MTPTPMTLATPHDSGTAQALAKVRNGSSWFFWIAGLSLVNALVTRTGADLSFILGLGITQVIDAIAGVVAAQLAGAALLIHGLALALDLGIAGLFALFGWLGRRLSAWALVVGMVLYALDALIFVLVESWLSVGFHLFALLAIFGGLRALFELRRLERRGLQAAAGPR